MKVTVCVVSMIIYDDVVLYWSVISVNPISFVHYSELSDTFSITCSYVTFFVAMGGKFILCHMVNYISGICYSYQLPFKILVAA